MIYNYISIIIKLHLLQYLSQNLSKLLLSSNIYKFISLKRVTIHETMMLIYEITMRIFIGEELFIDHYVKC